MSKYYFTMIVYVDDDTTLDKSVRSIFSVSPDIREITKLVIVDPFCNETVKAVVNEWKQNIGENNLVYIEALGDGIAEGYNKAVPEIRGTYVNFSLASTWFDDGTLESVRYVAEERERPKMIALPPWTVNEKNEVVQYGMSPVCTKELYENIRFYNEPYKLHLYFHAYFIRTFLIKDKDKERSFRTELQGDAVMEMLMELLAEWRGYVYLQTFKFHYSLQLEDNTSAFIDQHHEWWYNDSFKNWILPFAQKWAKVNWPIEDAMRVALLYLVFARFNCNYNDRNKGVICDEKLDEFFDLTGKILQYIDVEKIYKKSTEQTFSINRSMRMLFIYLKAKGAESEAEVVSMNNNFCLWIHEAEKDVTKKNLEYVNLDSFPDNELLSSQNKELGSNISVFTIERNEKDIPEAKMAYPNMSFNTLCKTSTEQVILTAINYIDGMLEIDGTYSGGDLLDNQVIKLKLCRDDKIYPVKYSEVYGLNRVFGKTYNHKYQFHVSVPGTAATGTAELQFLQELNGEDIVLQIRSESMYSHLRADVKGQYWRYSKDWSINIAEKNKLRIIHLTEDKAAQKEKDFRAELQARAKKGDLAAQKALELREKYFEAKAQNPDSRIWITFDKLYKAGDNGEYMYDYISTHHPEIDIRYLIKEDSVDYKRMEEKGDNLLVWGKDETLLTALLAEVIMTTHANVVSYVGFDKTLIPYICDLFNPVNVCIQHGLTTQDIAQFQNRLFDNLQLYLCASPNEIRNLSRPIYGFNNPKSLQLTGVARYDGLKSNDCKQILITPTWRRNIANANVAHFKKGHNDYFKESEYYHIYNSLINDPRLIKCAKSTGYRLIYLLHPAASAQIDDFDRNDYVEIIAAAGDMNYEKILTESSLMVTDYSGVQFDFAYMRKPILYYHPSTIPPHYNESEAYVYERDAFGPIIDNHEDLVNSLCEYMKKKCKTEEMYVQRADSFFAYKDHENCSRIFEAINRFVNKK